MTLFDYILPMAITKRIVFLTYTGAELLDLSGPMSVFNAASQISEIGAYKCVVASAKGGLITHSCGAQLNTLPIRSIRFRTTDTALVIGALLEPVNQAVKLDVLTLALVRAAKQVERYGSICSGSFLLGAAGLLDGKTIATHWAAHSAHEHLFRKTTVDRDSLYVRDDRLWTSAGVTTGIDMALAMIEEDFDSNVKSQVAKLLVVYSHRPGSQSQFSDVLIAQSRTDSRFTGLVDWLRQRLDRPPQVDEMADYVNMSPRSFSRKFKTAFDTSPGKFLERLRLDRARELIECGETTKVVAPKIGFSSQAAFRSAFKGAYGVTPNHHSAMSKSSSPA